MNEYREIDRWASRCGLTAVRSEGQPLTLEEIALGIGEPVPVTAGDLARFAAICNRWGIRCNLDDEAPVATGGHGNWSWLRGRR